MPKINAVHRDLASRVAVILIYLQEAHPSDVWPVGGVSVNPCPRSIEDRQRAALAFRDRYAIEPPIYCDPMDGDDGFDAMFGAWPDQAYCVKPETRKVIFVPKMVDAHYVTDWTEALRVMYEDPPHPPQ